MNEDSHIGPTMPAKWVCIAFDETKCFHIEEEDRPYIKQIDAVFYYNENELTCICSATPLYFMRALRHSVHFNYDNFEPDTEAEIQDRISNRYEIDCQPEDCYMNVSFIDRIDVSRKIYYGPTDDDEEEVREYWQGNHVV